MSKCTPVQIEQKRVAAIELRKEVAETKICRSLVNWLVARTVRSEKLEAERRKNEEWKVEGEKTYNLNMLGSKDDSFVLETAEMSQRRIIVKEKATTSKVINVNHSKEDQSVDILQDNVFGYDFPLVDRPSKKSIEEYQGLVVKIPLMYIKSSIACQGVSVGELEKVEGSPLQTTLVGLPKTSTVRNVMDNHLNTTDGANVRKSSRVRQRNHKFLY